jgi:hypothetical protein
MDGHETLITSIANEITEKFVPFLYSIEQRLQELPIGATLCVHDVFNTNFYDCEYRPEGSISALVESHALKSGQICDAKVNKTQYGPKTPEIAAEMERILSHRKE